MEKSKKEKPEVFALSKGEKDWSFSRRDFLKAASAGAAAVGLSLNGGIRRKVAFAQEDLEGLCGGSKSHEKTIGCLALSHDGTRLASADVGGVVKIWSFPEGQFIASYKGTNQIMSLAFDPSDSFLFVGDSAGTLRRHNTADLKAAGELKLEESFRVLKFSQTGKLYAGLYDGKFIIFPDADIEAATIDSSNTFKLPYSNPYDILLLENETQMLYGNTEMALFLYDIENAKTIERFDQGARVNSICALPGNARALISRSDDVVKLISLVTFETIWEVSLPNATTGIFCTAVSPDGSICIAQDREGITLLSAEDGSTILEIETASDGGKTLCVSADGAVLAGINTSDIRFWSLPDGKLIGCPFDLKEMRNTQKGIEVQKVDSVTGKTVTYTLPCGAAIPDGAVCVCNCVAGSQCSCVGYEPCSCDGHTATYCSCDTVVTESHYWYPN